MKGLYFINTDIRNARAHTYQIVNTISSFLSEVSVTLVAPRYHRGNLDLNDLLDMYGPKKMPQIRFLWNFGFTLSGVLSFIFYNIPAIFLYVKERLRGKVDFIYIRSSFLLPLVGVAYILRTPIYFETHRTPLSWSEKIRDYLIARMARGIIVISKYVEQYYKPYKKPILVVHDAVSLERFESSIGRTEARRAIGYSDDAHICVYTGTVSRLKGIQYVIESARLLPQTIFLLVGPVSYPAIDVDLPSNVILLGKKRQETLPGILRAADVLLLPHPDNEYSQSPMKLFEYMASGVPIVSSRLPSLTEVINDSNSILVEPESGNALVEGISFVKRDASVGVQRARQALQDVQEYTWSMRGKRITDFIFATV